MKCSREVCKVLITESRSWHREYINANKPDSTIYKPGDIVLAKVELQSSKKYCRVGKIAYKFRGPWKIKEKLPRGSYVLERCIKPSKVDKKQASQIISLLAKLIPFPPLNDPYTAYQQLHKNIKTIFLRKWE